MRRTDPLVMRAAEVLAELQAWQECIGEVADSLGFASVADRLDWLAAQPVLPPSRIEQAVFAQQGLTIHQLHARAVAPRPRPEPKGPSKPASLSVPKKTTAYVPTARHLEIAMRALDNQRETAREEVA